jgi:hypothetical protein
MCLLPFIFIQLRADCEARNIDNSSNFSIVYRLLTATIGNKLKLQLSCARLELDPIANSLSAPLHFVLRKRSPGCNAPASHPKEYAQRISVRYQAAPAVALVQIVVGDKTVAT